MHRFGYRPDLMDQRDHLFSVVHQQPSTTPLPVRTSLRARMPAIWDQGDLGSCVGHGSAAAVAFLHAGFMPSRLQIYGEARKLEGTFGQDSGCEIRDAIKQLAKLGCAPEADWPYIVAKFNKAWPASATKDAKAHLISSYSRLTSRTNYRSCLADGFPIVAGFTLYESFESEAVAKSGIVPMPGKKEKVLGGHCMAIIGYDDEFSRGGVTGKYYELRNSWGPDFGDAGHVWMPAAYVESANLADDFWTVRA